MNEMLPVSYPTSSLNLKGAKMLMDAAQHIIRWQHNRETYKSQA
jgi:hypothetical protein